MNKKIAKSLLTVALALLTTSAWADFTAQVNTNSVIVNDSFDLTLSSDDVSRRSIPDLTPLENDFKILGMSQSMQTHIVNGYTTYKHNWTIKLSPRMAGEITIPPIRLGKESTLPITLQSIEQGQIASQNDQTMSITATINDENTGSTSHNNYIFQEIPLTVRIETTQPVAQAELIVTDIADLEIEQQGEDKPSQIVRNGQRITVIERQYILRPQKIGTFEIPPIVIKGVFRGRRASQFGIEELLGRQFGQEFGSLFDDLSGMGGVGREFVAKTDPITLTIKANPNGSNEWFLPAKAVEMFSEWRDNGEKVATPSFKAGEPITRQMSLVAVGATPEQLPKLEIPEVDGVQFYIDSDKTEKVQTNKGIVARRVVSVSVVPEYGGEFTLPEITVKWQNTKTDKAETAILPAETIQVLGANGQVDDSNNINNAVTNTNESAEKSHSEGSSNEANVTEDSFIENNKWLLTGGAGLVLLLLVGYMYRNRKSNLKKLEKGNSHNENGKQIDTISTVQNTVSNIENDIHQALNSSNVERLYQALMNYKMATATDKKVDQKKLNQLIEKLEQSLYGKTEQVNVKYLSDEVSDFLSKSTIVDSDVYNKKPVTELPALYRK